MKEYVTTSIALSGKPSSDVFNYKTKVEQIREDLRSVDSAVSGKTAHINVALEEYKSTQTLIADAPFVPAEAVTKLDDIYKHIQAASDDFQALIRERESISNKLDAINLDFEKMSERIQDLFELAGLGISVETFTHEFDSSIKNIRIKNQQVVSAKDQASVDTLIRHINYVTFSLDALRKQMSYFNPGLKFVRAEKQVFSISEFVSSHKDFYNGRCQGANIEFISSIQTDFKVKLNRGMLNQVFDNLFSNSEYWLDYSLNKRLIERKEYTISSSERGIIVVWDNGIGISRDIETRLFDPFESKKQHGRGLGLYIAAGNLQYNSSRIRLLNERNKFGNLYKFEIDLSQVMQ